MHNGSLYILFQSPSKKRQLTVAQEKKDDEATKWANRGNLNFEAEKKSARSQFPVSRNMCLASAGFWAVMIFLIYLAISYGLIYSRIKQESDLDGNCKSDLISGKEENMEIVSCFFKTAWVKTGT